MFYTSTNPEDLQLQFEKDGLFQCEKLIIQH